MAFRLASMEIPFFIFFLVYHGKRLWTRRRGGCKSLPLLKP
nr:MAG TPA: hypothetical protein [Caudoviricetes sp.]